MAERQRIKDEEVKLKEKIQKQLREEETNGKSDLPKIKRVIFILAAVKI
jgi:hypothetical protein